MGLLLVPIGPIGSIGPPGPIGPLLGPIGLAPPRVASSLGLHPLPSPPLQEADAFAAPADLFGLGLVLAIVGSFLLANSILFRHPRTLVSQYFGGDTQRLSSIRSYIFHRVQVHLGFLFLLAGFGLQLFGHYREGAARPPDAGPAPFPVMWIGIVVVAVVALELGGWWLSHALFRRYLREYFLAHPPALESDMALARELGELFSIPSEGDDSVQTYLRRIRQHIGIASVAVPVTESERRKGFGDAETEEEFELTS